MCCLSFLLECLPEPALWYKFYDTVMVWFQRVNTDSVGTSRGQNQFVFSHLEKPEPQKDCHAKSPHMHLVNKLALINYNILV